MCEEHGCACSFEDASANAQRLLWDAAGRATTELGDEKQAAFRERCREEADVEFKRVHSNKLNAKRQQQHRHRKKHHANAAAAAGSRSIAAYMAKPAAKDGDEPALTAASS